MLKVSSDGRKAAARSELSDPRRRSGSSRTALLSSMSRTQSPHSAVVPVFRRPEVQDAEQVVGVQPFGDGGAEAVMFWGAGVHRSVQEQSEGVS